MSGDRRSVMVLVEDGADSDLARRMNQIAHVVVNLSTADQYVVLEFACRLAVKASQRPLIPSMDDDET